MLALLILMPLLVCTSGQDEAEITLPEVGTLINETEHYIIKLNNLHFLIT